MALGEGVGAGREEAGMRGCRHGGNERVERGRGVPSAGLGFIITLQLGATTETSLVAIKYV